MWTIYVLGNVDTFYGILNADAMFFATGIMSGGGLGMGSGAVLGLLVSIMLMLGQYVLTHVKGGGYSFNPATLLVLMIAYSVMSIPTRVTIQDVYTGTTTAVSNVPFGVAVPASVISSILYNATNNIETAFSTTNGNYIGMSSEGFVNPLALLLSLRGNHVPFTGVAQYYTSSLSTFMMYCNANAPGFAVNSFQTANNFITYMTTVGNYKNGITTYFNAANPQGIPMTCSAAASQLVTDEGSLFVGAGTSPSIISAFINENMNSSPPGSAQTNATWTTTNLSNAYSGILSSILGASASAQNFMVNAAMSGVANDSYNCLSNSATYANYQQCIVSTEQTVEQYKADSVMNASAFTKMIIPSMTILTAIFFAFAPLVFLFMMMTGMHGFSILTKYLLFGIWTQSWLPFAAIINYIIQLMVPEDLNRALQLPNNTPAVTIGNVGAMYDVLSVKIAIASDMLASVPMLSMAILTGSYYGLTSIAQRFSGRDFSDDKSIAPNLQSSASATSAGHLLGGKDAGTFTPTNVMGNSGFSSLSAAPPATVTTGEARSSVLSNASQVVQSQIASLGNTLLKKLSDVRTIDAAASTLAGVGQSMTKSNTVADRYVSQVARDFAKQHKLTDKEQLELAGGLMIASSMLPGQATTFMSGLLQSIKSSGGFSGKLSGEEANSMANSLTEKIQNSHEITSQTVGQYAQNLNQTLQSTQDHKQGLDFSDTDQANFQAAQTYSETAQQVISDQGSQNTSRTLSVATIPSELSKNNPALFLQLAQMGANLTPAQRNAVMLAGGIGDVSYYGGNPMNQNAALGAILAITPALLQNQNFKGMDNANMLEAGSDVLTALGAPNPASYSHVLQQPKVPKNFEANQDNVNSLNAHQPSLQRVNTSNIPSEKTFNNVTGTSLIPPTANQQRLASQAAVYGRIAKSTNQAELKQKQSGVPVPGMSIQTAGGSAVSGLWDEIKQHPWVAFAIAATAAAGAVAGGVGGAKNNDTKKQNVNSDGEGEVPQGAEGGPVDAKKAVDADKIEKELKSAGSSLEKTAGETLKSKGWMIAEEAGQVAIKTGEGLAVAAVEAEPVGWVIDAAVGLDALANLVRTHPQYAADAEAVLKKMASVKTSSGMKEMVQGMNDLYSKAISKMSPEDLARLSPQH